MNGLSITLLAALAGTLAVTPLVRRLAVRYQLVDQPDGHRKLHSRTIPLGGGLAVFVGISLGILTLWLVSAEWSGILESDGLLLLGLLVSASLLMVIGLIDDRFGLRGRQKLMGQVAAIGTLVACGLVIDNMRFLDWRIELGLLAIPVTICFMLGAINALNLLDGVDGLAASTAIILSLALSMIALMNDHPTEAVVALAVAGALIGFLYYNFPPASIFLGDAGSMLLGLLLGVLAIRSSLKGAATVALAAPMAIWAIPFLDVTMAILRRKLTGRSIYSTDRSHLHHILQSRGYSSRKTVGLIVLMCGITTAGALLSVHYGNELLAVGTVAIVVLTLILTRLFGHSESVLLWRRLAEISSSLISRRTQRRTTRQFSARLHGNFQCDQAWQTLLRCADVFELSFLQLNLSLPAKGEDYHATWKRTGSGNGNGNGETDSTWRIELPLLHEHAAIGLLTIVGPCDGGASIGRLEDLMASLDGFEQQLAVAIDEDILVELAPPSLSAMTSALSESVTEPAVLWNPATTQS